ncbi:MAG: hypothetical protein EPO08_10485 [Rhodospirillaceae bacterium]|nr:MAG: hypothetical protein EPO08_10485 [Rhodospirillaceae bacterium]
MNPLLYSPSGMERNTIDERGPRLMDGAPVHRRTAMSLISAGIASATIGWPGFSLADTHGDLPLLATPEQLDAEKTLLHLLKDPELKQLQAKMRAELAATPRGQMSDGAARIHEAVSQWTNTVILAEITDCRRYPAFLWCTDDTSHTWLGHTIGGIGSSGDNPDAIYRSAIIDGSGSYEILGQIDMAKRPVQFVLEADLALLTKPESLMGPKPKNTDVGSNLAVFTDRTMVIAPDGSFRITLGGAGDGPNHGALQPGRVTIGIRDILQDWTQRPARLTIRRLDKSGPEPFNPADIRRRVFEDLPGFIRFWAAFPDIWMGNLKPNTFAEPKQRYGGFGFVSGLRFELNPDEAIVVTTSPGAASYTGFQLIDPWMIAPDARRNQCCLSKLQARANADGTYTYVIAQTDPGVANWLDTAGLHQGYGIMRWQSVPADMTNKGLIRDFRVVPLSGIASMTDLARVTPEERRQQIAIRTENYNSRVR